MGLSDKQLQDVCLIHGHPRASQCRYLDVEDDACTCKKLTSAKSDIDDEVDAYLQEMKAKNIDPYKQDAPVGDNCSGFLPLRHLTQGYDIKKKKP